MIYPILTMETPGFCVIFKNVHPLNPSGRVEHDQLVDDPNDRNPPGTCL